PLQAVGWIHAVPRASRWTRRMTQQEGVMKRMVISRRDLLKGAGAAGVLGAVGIPTPVFADGIRVRWAIISVDFPTGTLPPGGMASARATDGSNSALSGSGPFSTHGR